MPLHQALQEPEALLLEIQAAKLLNLSVKTLQAWRNRKRGPTFIRAGRAVRYRRSDILQWVEANAVSVGAPQ
ncbi:MAG: helix-turn-helix domain-containing protein [Rhizobiales bacterium]|jgi:excisionase family DNA binding protein|nr:helix-turn-helix domain-containing protein [Hyphomicrobiales bacterium]